MDQLKVALADKILELSNNDSATVEAQLKKIQRFKDFAEACRYLMTMYPEIEGELLEMVKNNNFDASSAARHVDAYIKKEHNVSSTANEVVSSFQNEVHDLQDSNYKDDDYIVDQDIPQDGGNHTDEDQEGADEPLVQTMDDYLNESRRYAVKQAPPAEDDELGERKSFRIRKEHLIIVSQVLSLVLSVLIVIWAVKFVVNYWKVILIAISIVMIIFVGWQILKVYIKKKKNKSAED